MTQEQWSRLFFLNDRLSHLVAAVAADLMEVEKISGESMIAGVAALDDFAVAMTKATDKLNERLSEDRDDFNRKQAVEDVLRDVKNKIRYKGKNRDNVREDRSETSEQG